MSCLPNLNSFFFFGYQGSGSPEFFSKFINYMHIYIYIYKRVCIWFFSVTSIVVNQMLSLKTLVEFERCLHLSLDSEA